jgi:hypothetical protein
MPSHVDVVDFTNYNSSPLIPSSWDRHAQYCPQCKRTIRLISKVSKFAARLSSVSMVAAMASLWISFVFSRTLLSTHPLLLPLVLLTTSIILQGLSMRCRQTLEQIFVSPKQVSRYQLMEIYSSQNVNLFH